MIQWSIGYEGSDIHAELVGTQWEASVIENWDTTPMSWNANVHRLEGSAWKEPVRKTHASLIELMNWVEEELKFRSKNVPSS